MEKENPNYYAIIPANVRYDKELKANCKLLYGEITALSNKEGYCWASNSYFSELYSVTPQAVSRWIKQLEEKGYVSLKYIRKGKEIIQRNIYVLVSTNGTGVSTNGTRVSTNGTRGYQQKVKESITSINNTINNTINKDTPDIGNTDIQIKSDNIISLDVYNYYCKKIKEDNKRQLGLNNINRYIEEYGINKLLYAIDRYAEETEGREEQYKKACYSFFAVRGEEIGFFKDYINKKKKEKKEVKIYNPLQQEEEIKF